MGIRRGLLMNQSWKSAFRGRKEAAAAFYQICSRAQTFLFSTGAQRFPNGLFDSAEPPGGPCLPRATKQWRGCQKVEGARGNKNTRASRLSPPAWTAYLTLNWESCLRLSIWPNAARRGGANTAQSRDSTTVKWVSLSSPGKIRGAVWLSSQRCDKTQYGDSLIEVTDLSFSLTFKRKKRKELTCKWPANKNKHTKKKQNNKQKQLMGPIL